MRLSLETRRALTLAVLAGFLSLPLLAAVDSPPVTIHRAAGPITLDGDLSDPGWNGAAKIDTWYETNPGDNTEPKVKNAGYLTYDDRFFYAGFDFEDPDTGSIRAPFGDHDAISQTLDYAGVILNPSNDRKSAVMFLASPHGILYDAISNDASGEDSSPDYYWESAAKIYPGHWTLEIRIPFSTLRYSNASPQTWGILLYRNFPRDRRYQFFSARLPRNSNCFICNSAPLEGLENLPQTSGLTLAPYAAAKQLSEQDESGDLQTDDPALDLGLDAKWRPTADTAVDLTVNPDFSQIEADVPVITANERFAIFFPEKRPFFLEGIDLFSTPIQAVYTRSITQPRWGARATGKIGSTAYTTLVAADDGGGSVIIPGPFTSSFAAQDFKSADLIARARRDIGTSFASLLLSARQIDGGGHNFVFGPDFQWRPNAQNKITGQFLLSDSDTPNRPDLADEWNGQHLASHAALLSWGRDNGVIDWYTQLNDLGDEFRADLGFVPQVGYREGYLEVGRTWHPTGFFSRIRLFGWSDYIEDQQKSLLSSQFAVGAGMDGRWSSFIRLWGTNDSIRVDGNVLPQRRLRYTFQISPNRVFNYVSLTGWVGQDIDYARARTGDGASVSLGATIRPGEHLELAFNNDVRYLDAEGERIFTAQIERLRATWTFSARSFIRIIGEHVRDDRNPLFYSTEHSGGLNASLLYAYKLNWQTVLFLGAGATDELNENASFDPSSRQLFMKISYAFQR